VVVERPQQAGEGKILVVVVAQRIAWFVAVGDTSMVSYRLLLFSCSGKKG